MRQRYTLNERINLRGGEPYTRGRKDWIEYIPHLQYQLRYGLDYRGFLRLGIRYPRLYTSIL